MRTTFFLLAIFVLLSSCAKINYLDDYAPLTENGNINVVIEIPTGTLQKWEVMKPDGILEWEMKDGKPRVVQYLGYPANYGMIPGTLLASEDGGDGDPLDVIVLGPPLERGAVVEARLIGVLQLLDEGEQDDKLIAVADDSPFTDIQDIRDLNREFIGVTNILQLWFTSYKGPGKLTSTGFLGKEEAITLLNNAIEAAEKVVESAL